MFVKDIMSTEVFTLRPEHTVDLAHDMMDWQRIRHIPVVDAANHLVGLVTHRDLLRASVSAMAKISREEQREIYQHIKVSDIMKGDVQSISPNADLREAAAMMIDEKLGCLPVVRDRKLIGIVTEADFLTLAWETLGRGAKQEEYTEIKKYATKARKARPGA